MFKTSTPCKGHFNSRICTIANDLLLLLTIFGTIAIDIAIAKDTSRLLLLVLLLLRGLSELLLLLLIAIFTIGQLCVSLRVSLENSLAGRGIQANRSIIYRNEDWYQTPAIPRIEVLISKAKRVVLMISIKSS